nr:hypothetical protein [Lelliottia nimipressuralis]
MPHPSDADESPNGALSLARAQWLSEYFYKRSANAVTTGIAQAFP